MLSNFSKHHFSLLFAFVYLKTVLHAQVLQLGSCPSPSVMSNFDIDQFSGKWYNNRNYFSIAQTGLDCVTTTYTNDGNGGSVFNIKIEGLKPNSAKKITAVGKGFVTSPGKATVTFVDTIWNTGTENYLYALAILDSDYTSYAVAWSCYPLGIGYLSLAWVLTREQNPPDAAIDAAIAVLQTNQIDDKKLKIVKSAKLPMIPTFLQLEEFGYFLEVEQEP
uniref:Lipocalin/cytosolic fatty-acid binding domain-containing protein n=1 Tax=Daphnia galeata TaxID=27404 RepID=A0A8J2WJN0_9CRUS|nr:unnamed protein product [Daphnia galeata]